MKSNIVIVLYIPISNNLLEYDRKGHCSTTPSIPTSSRITQLHIRGSKFLHGLSHVSLMADFPTHEVSDHQGNHRLKEAFHFVSFTFFAQFHRWSAPSLSSYLRLPYSGTLLVHP